MSVAQVQAIVLPRLGPGGEIQAISVVENRGAAAKVEPGLGQAEGTEASVGPVWVVRGLGQFSTQRTPNGSVASAGSGYYVIDDADGTILSMGFP